MDAPYTLAELRALITPVAKKHGVKRVSVFGSYGRGEATAASDVDLHIENGKIRTLWQLSAFYLDMEESLKVPLDLVTNGIRDKAFLDRIKPDEVMLYEQ